MPEMSVTAYERAVMEYAQTRHVHISKCRMKGVAKAMARRQAHINDLELSKIFGTLFDETPHLAYSGIVGRALAGSEDDMDAALRLGLIGAGA